MTLGVLSMQGYDLAEKSCNLNQQFIQGRNDDIVSNGLQ
jgi:hypothetical protein